MKKMIKVMSLSMMLMLMFAVVAIPVMAGDVYTIPTPTGSDASTSISNAGGRIAGIAATIGVAVALVILIWLAIKYITAAPSDKADIKKSAVTYVIGAILLFAASGILGLIQGFADQFEGDMNGGGVDAVSGAGQIVIIEKA